jgi:hypothetical protein
LATAFDTATFELQLPVLGEVMLRFTSFFILLAVFAGTANAEWLGGSGEDPMTDKKWVAASSGFSPSGLPQVIFKCWEGGQLQVGIVVGQYDDSASYASISSVKFRVDKNEPVDLIAVPANLNGLLSLTATSEVNAELVPFLKQILDSRQRVALSVGDAVYEADVRGTSNAIGAMFKTCGLAGSDEVQDDQPKKADEADQSKKVAEAPVPQKAISPEPSKTPFLIPSTFVQIEYSHAETSGSGVALAGTATTGKLENTTDEVRVGFKYLFPVASYAGVGSLK